MYLWVFCTGVTMNQRINNIEFYLEHEQAFAYVSAKERESLPLSSFGWPSERKFPVTNQRMLDAAVKLIGRAPASEQPKIKARLKRIGKRLGLKLPESWGGST
jgi:hypothetical protein